MASIENKTTSEMEREDLEKLLKETRVDASGIVPDAERRDRLEHPAQKSDSRKQLLSSDAFEKLNKKPPLAKRPGLRAGMIGSASLLLILILGLMFRGNVTVDQPAVVADADTAEGVDPFSPEADEVAQLKAENAQLKREMGLSSQSLNQSELDALARDPVSIEKSPSDVPQPSQPKLIPVASSPTPPPVRSAPVNSVSYRAPASAPRATRAPAPMPAAQPSAVVRATAPPEPIDPYAMRDRLSQLGSYGQPVTLAKAETNPSFGNERSLVVNPQRPQTQTVAYRPAERMPTQTAAPAQEDEYYEDVAAALGVPRVEVSDPVDPSALAILPGETFKAELINGVSWSNGDRPEVALQTTEDFRVEDATIIPKNTRIIATLMSIDDAGAMSFDITQIFMDEALNIPPGSLVIQAEDGSILRATRAGEQRGRSDFGRTIWGSALNVLDNVIEGDDTLVGDLAGGVGEAVLEGQRERVDREADRRVAIANSEASIWELSPREVQIFVSRYIPLGESDEN